MYAKLQLVGEGDVGKILKLPRAATAAGMNYGQLVRWYYTCVGKLYNTVSGV